MECKHCGSKPETLKNIVKRLVKAEVARSWMGAQPPEDWPTIEAELKLARAAWKAELERISP